MSQTIFCPSCGKGLPTNLSFCPACATPLPKVAPEEAPTQRDLRTPQTDFPPPHRWMETQEAPPRPVTPLPTNPPVYQPPAAQPKLFPCPDCGRMISRMAAFCPQCGSNLQAAHAQRQGIHMTGQPLPPTGAGSFSQRSANEKLLVILLAVIAACVILGFFC